MTLPDSADLATYGGAKTNLSPVEDYSTDEDAGDRNQYVADVAGMTHTACRAWRSFVTSATTPTDPSSAVHDANWGNANGVLAAATRSSTGTFLLTWPTTIVDSLGVTKTINLRRAWCSVEGATPLFVTATVTSPNVVTVRVYSAAGALTDAAGTTLTVFAV